MNEFESYYFGLLLTDGNLSLYERNRGKVTLEVSEKDADIVELLVENIPNSTLARRERSTNFSDDHKSVIFSNHKKEFRDFLIENGFPAKDKTEICGVPSGEYLERDFWRGVIDGDGSIGYIADGSPFISLVTKSENLKNSFLELLKKRFNIIKNINRNKRDGIYNIMVKNEEALLLGAYLYEDSKFFIQRKYESFLSISGWKRTRKKINRQSWTSEEDSYILSHSVEESMKHLNRTKASIAGRIYRLSKTPI